MATLPLKGGSNFNIIFKESLKKKTNNSCWNQKHLELDHYTFLCVQYFGGKVPSKPPGKPQRRAIQMKEWLVTSLEVLMGRGC